MRQWKFALHQEKCLIEGDQMNTTIESVLQKKKIIDKEKWS